MVSFGALAKKIFGSSNDRRVNTYRPVVDQINALEPEMEALSDAALKARTDAFRKQIKDGAKLDDLLVEAFATVREAAKRSLGQRHYDVQLLGGMTLNDRAIAEMKTGEGKTLVATLAVYLNALTERGVHVVTVNDYLAKRDSEWMGQVYEFLGLSVGVILHDLDDAERKNAYACDVTYGTNNEFGFDYLRDNMKHEIGEMVQRGHFYAIVDEVDSILIDEARTPLIISGPVEDKTELYTKVDAIMEDFLKDPAAASFCELDEKMRTVTFTEEGNLKIEELLKKADLLKGDSLYDVENVTLVHHATQALRAHKLFQRDKDYIVKNDQVIIIDEFTGRMMEGRRFSEGLHQSLEAKENVRIESENQTLASITFQNYFRLYEKLSGMTGTALTEADEFSDIYGLEVVEIPTNRELTRIDDDDEMYRTAEEKYHAIIALISDCHDRGQPMLVGTTSIEKSELVSAMLSDMKVLKKLGIEKPIPHQVLNARFHEQEASIIAQAGVPGGVTIATNMAGRGTDIQLGGNLDMLIENQTKDIKDDAERDKKTAKITEDAAQKKQKALAAGGLYVVGTERHESRRIDNQLRGRSGRQGDPGNSKFFLSLEDDLMRIFGSERMDGMLSKLGLEEGEAIMHSWINKALEKAQGKVEARNFDIRKNLLKFDDVMNDQRKVIFEHRIEMMEDDDVSETIVDMRHDVVEEMIARHIPPKAFAEQWETEELQEEVKKVFNLALPITEWADEEGIADEEIHDRLIKEVNETAAARTAQVGADMMRRVEKAILLQTLDHLWRDHLGTLEHLRQVVGLRGYGQRDPLNEYKTESFTLFESLLSQLRTDTTRQLMQLDLGSGNAEQMTEMGELPEMEAHHVNPMSGFDEFDEPEGDFYADAGGIPVETEFKSEPLRSRQAAENLDPKNPETWGKVARNAPCPCGSGKKYKQCHGKF